MAGQWHHRWWRRRKKQGKIKGEEEEGGTWGRRKKGATSMQWERGQEIVCSRDRVQRTFLKCLPSVSASPLPYRMSSPFYWEGSRVFRASTDLVEAGGGRGPQHLESSLPPTPRASWEQEELDPGAPLCPRGAHWVNILLVLTKSADTLRCFWLCCWASQEQRLLENRDSL